MASAPCSVCGSKEGPGHQCSGQTALLGKTLDGRYQIEEVLGQGGMGMVFLATQTSMRRPVAVKTLHPALAAAPTFFERFRREAEVASNLHHPNIITVFDFGKAPDGTCYYVMEYLKGESLKQIVKRDGPMSLRRAVGIIEQAGRGLHHAHTQSAVHRDLKPHNIMVQNLDGADFVKVLDFGLVKALEQEEEEQLTSTGQVLGTPQYMPPEQAGGESVDQRSDLYSLAGVLYYCLTGTSPFGANTVRKALRAALTETVPPVSTHRMGAPVPRTLDEFFRKGLAREKKDRHQSAEEFINEMVSALSGLTDAELDAVPSNAAPSTRREGSGGSQSRNQKPRLGMRTPSGAAGSAKRSPPLPPGVVVGGGSASAPRPTSPEVPSNKNPSGEEQLPPGSRGWLRWVAAAAVLAMLAGGGAVALRKNGSELSIPPQVATARAGTVPVNVAEREAPLPADIEVLVNSTPAGAAVFEGERWMGKTPVTLRLNRDTGYRLTLKLAGYAPIQRDLDFKHNIDPRAEVEIPLEAVKVAAPEKEKPPEKTANTKSSGKKKGSGEDIPVFE